MIEISDELYLWLKCNALGTSSQRINLKISRRLCLNTGCFLTELKRSSPYQSYWRIQIWNVHSAWIHTVITLTQTKQTILNHENNFFDASESLETKKQYFNRALTASELRKDSGLCMGTRLTFPHKNGHLLQF